jgi:hypothetical protein
MALELQAKTGPQDNGNGSPNTLRSLREGSLAVRQLGGKYQELVAEGRLFHVCSQAAGVAPGTAIGTAAAFTLYNPASSGKKLVIVQTQMVYVSGTLGTGNIDYVASKNPVAAAPTGTGLTEVNALIGAGALPVGQGMETVTLPAAPTLIRPFCSLTPLLASSVLIPWIVVDDVDGMIVVGEGCAVSLEATAAAGTSPLVQFGMSWYEIPA